MTELKHHLASDPTFDVQTEKCGRLIVDNLVVKHWRDIEKAIKDEGDVSPSKLIDIFIATLAKTEAGERLTPDQISSLSTMEKDDFAEQLLGAEDHMYREIIHETNKDEKGNTVLRHRKGDVLIPREENESAASYFHRLFMEFRAKQFPSPLSGGISDSLLKSVTGWASPSTISAIAANAAISENIAKSLASTGGFSSPKIPQSISDNFTRKKGNGYAISTGEPHIEAAIIPKNPVLGTNERLDNLLERFERVENIATQTVELVHSMNTVATGLLKSFTDGARATDRFSRRSIWIAGMALFAAIAMPIFQIGYDAWNSRQQDTETKRVIQDVVRQIIDSEHQNLNELSATVSDRLGQSHVDEVELVNALSSLSKEMRALREYQEEHLPPSKRVDNTKPRGKP